MVGAIEGGREAAERQRRVNGRWAGEGEGECGDNGETSGGGGGGGGGLRRPGIRI
jgi:hypothetical protein